jgi:hypothetical protein
MKRKLVLSGKRMKPTDGRALRYVDTEVIMLFKEIMSMYGTNGTKLLFQAIVDGKLKPRL